MKMIKEQLREIRKIDYIIQHYQLELNKLDDLDNPNIDIIQQYTNELNNAIEILISKKLYLKSIIEKLDNADMVDILYRRYFHFQKWEYIASEKGYTYQGLHKIHAKALIILEKIINC